MAILEAGEKIIWQGASKPKRVHKFVFLFAVLLTFILIWLGWGDSSPLKDWAPFLTKTVFGILAFVTGAFAALGLLNVVNSDQIYLTNKRVLSTNKNGKVSPQSGFPYNFNETCSITKRGVLSDLDIPTVQIDHGYPEFFSLGGLEADVAIALSETFEDLKVSANRSRTGA